MLPTAFCGSVRPRTPRRGGLRLLSLLLLSVVAVLGPTSPALAQSVPSPNPVTSPDQVEGATWAVTLGPAPLRSQPDDNSEQFSELRPGSPVQILGYADTWAFVFNPRAGQQGTAYVHSDLLGPSDPPSAYVFKTPPADQDSVDQTGQLTADTPLAVYPSPDPAAELSQLDQGTWVTISATVEGDDGAQWYRTDDGNFLPRDAVALGPQPSAPTVAAAPTPPTQTYQGRWLDVDLTEPAHITAYQDNTPARTMLTIKGRVPRPTPVGQFTILRRVANETMDSSTIGIPHNGPGGYYLKNVLFTQYFTSDGASLHYNYWSSNFGYSGSHGCLGLSYADSAWLWNWATVGTPLSIHY